jgi:hypothetical protein
MDNIGAYSRNAVLRNLPSAVASEAQREILPEGVTASPEKEWTSRLTTLLCS